MKFGTLVLCGITLMIMASGAPAREIWVAKTGSDANDGDQSAPYLTINHAAQQAMPGDRVTVRAGTYREWVKPVRGGLSESSRITYQAAPGEDVRMIGSEPVTGWERSGNLWQVTLPDSFFGDMNPFSTSIRNPDEIGESSDDPAREWGWLMYGRWAHLGDVYLDGEGLTEQETSEGLSAPMTWHVTSEQGQTTITANFGDANPNAAQVEVNVRPHAFFPVTPGLGYITVRGFKMLNTATWWAPPIVFQPGAIGPNGGHHWIIEHNLVRHAKTVCISLGNPSGEADVTSSGRHVVRHNILRKCGQAGIAGQRWNSYSHIHDNIIEDINYRNEFGGYETAGIKFHHATGSLIEHNFIHDVSSTEGFSGHGIWIDFKNRDIRITRNVLYRVSGISIYMEANWGGPFSIDNNIIFGNLNKSSSSRDEVWAHNLIVGTRMEWEDQTFGGRPPVDNARWLNNVFAGHGLEAAPKRNTFVMNDNLFLAGAQPSWHDPDSLVSEFDPAASLSVDDSGVTLTYRWPEEKLSERKTQPAHSDHIGMPLESMDGVQLNILQDFFGQPFAEKQPMFGPFADPAPGHNQVNVFSFPDNYSQMKPANTMLGHFNIEKDLYLANFDSKTDADDIHSVAGVATMLRDPRFAGVEFHAVAGAYGIQEGLYVPSPELFELVFGEHWSDAHTDREKALEEVTERVMATLSNGGHVWVAEAGQSDFTADWLRRVRSTDLADLTSSQVHVVQHSDWNESVTSPDKLAYVQRHASYHRIADGNVVGNGTPGFRLESDQLWDVVLNSPEHARSWQLARSIAEEYNGKDGRYVNSAITVGGMDFSDVAETCWIFGFADTRDARAFFEEFPGEE